MAPQKTNRLVVIDCFRGLAILLVLLYHYTYSLSLNLPYFALGYLGVQFFFVVSGFVIFLTLQQCRSAWQFSLKRFSRLYPAYFFVILINLLIYSWLSTDLIVFDTSLLASNLLMLAPHFGQAWIDPVFWSLLVEIKFYVWVAVIYYLFRERFVPVWCGFSVSTVGFHHFSDTLSWLTATDQLAFFCLGMALYERFRIGKVSGDSVMLHLTALILYIVHWHDESWTVHLVIGGVWLGFELFLLGLLDRLRFSGLSYLGLISYSLYLVHRNLFVVMEDIFSWRPEVLLPMASILSVLLSTSLFLAIEKPAQSTLRRVFDVR